MVDATEYPAYRLVSQVFIRQPLSQTGFVLDLPSTIPAPLPRQGPYGP